MKIGRIIHQQVVQLKWHVLACLGLLMALPIEEAVMNLKEGDGFYATGLSLTIPVMAGALLAGLIACGNVQADLDEKRYIFWRSKPVGVKTFVALKYVVGFFVAFVVIACPVAFVLISCNVIQGEKLERGLVALIINFQLISLLTYSLCFFCNALVRKTARAWLIGMAMACFLLLVPFVLPFSFKDISGDFLLIASAVYISITIGASFIAFILSLFAVSRNWHLQTNLKGLLWTGATLIFLILLLFTHQVANIKVLDEVELPKDYVLADTLRELYSITQEGHLIEVDTSNGRIELKDVYLKPSEELQKKRDNGKLLYSVGEKDLELNLHRYPEQIYYTSGDETYFFKLDTYIRREEITKRTYQEKLRKVYLSSYQLLEGHYSFGVCALDLSDCIVEDSEAKVGLRRVDDKIIVFVQDSFAVIQIKEGGALEVIDKRINGLRRNPRFFSTDTEKEFKVKLIALPEIDVKERIRLSIDVYARYYHIYGSRNRNFHDHSLVDIYGDTISFCLLDRGGIQRYDVIKSDDEYVYCKFRDERPFTFLEQMFSQVTEYDPLFIQGGKLYVYEDQKLMAFDIRSNRIRKLGHFERLSENYSIQDIEVLDNGDILLCAETERRVLTKSADPNRKHNDHFIRKGYLSLLKDPE